MKVCLINPQGKHASVFQPLGLAYLAAAIEKQHEVKIVDLQVQSLKEAVKFSPDVVSISITHSANASKAFAVARKFKQKVVIGGPHASIRPDECKRYADCVVIGEGEKVFPKIINEEIVGIVKADTITDLDSIPFPARHLLPMRRYFMAAKMRLAGRGIREPWATMVTSRGCSYNCIFCSIHLTMGKRWRARSPENVVDEIEEIIKKFGVRLISFEDDNISLDPNRLYRICDLIIKRHLRFRWNTPNGIRADTLDRGLLKKMKEAGCFEVWFAPESGVQRVVDKIIQKNLNLEKVIENIKVCREIGINVGCFFVIGIAGETVEDAENTMRFAYEVKKLGAAPYINMALPLYGTRLYETAKKLGCLKDFTSDDLFYNEQVYIDTPHFPANEFHKIHRSGLYGESNFKRSAESTLRRLSSATQKLLTTKTG